AGRACFFFQAEAGIRDFHVTGVQTCALPIWRPGWRAITSSADEPIEPVAPRTATDCMMEADLMEAGMSEAGMSEAEQFLAEQERSEERRVGKECGSRRTSRGRKTRRREREVV